MKNLLSAAVALALTLLAPHVASAQLRGAVRPPTVRPVAPMAKAPAPAVTPKPVAQAARSAAPPTPASTVTKSPATVAKPTTMARVQGNSLISNKPQQMYGIFGTNTNTGKTTVHKFGVSGGTSRSGSQLPPSMQRRTLAPSRDYSNRALQQVKQLNNQARMTGQPMKYSTRTLQRLPSQPSVAPTARQSILAAEKQAVTKHFALRGSSPTGNPLPKPAPLSRINK